jgi:peroxiredoxin
MAFILFLHIILYIKKEGIIMALMHTPVCDFNSPAIDFELKDTQGKTYQLADCVGSNGLLVMFICNHCPYVKKILHALVEDTRSLIQAGIGCVAIMANDYQEYPDDAPEHMADIAARMDFPFPYLIDETQAVAKSYGAVCTPDFFGYNKELKLQYRGRFGEGELLSGMQQIAKTGQGPSEQVASMGCSIKWK